MRPSGQVKVKTNATIKSRVSVYNHGQHPDVINEGDLLLISDNGEIEFQLLIRGRDMFMLKDQVLKAFDLYEANKDWLSRPATIIKMPEPTSRVQANLNAINNYYKSKTTSQK